MPETNTTLKINYTSKKKKKEEKKEKTQTNKPEVTVKYEHTMLGQKANIKDKTHFGY